MDVGERKESIRKLVHAMSGIHRCCHRSMSVPFSSFLVVPRHSRKNSRPSAESNFFAMPRVHMVQRWLFILWISPLVLTQENFQSILVTSRSGTQYVPVRSASQLISASLVASFRACATACHGNAMCRVFDYGVQQARECRLFDRSFDVSRLTSGYTEDITGSFHSSWSTRPEPMPRRSQLHLPTIPSTTLTRPSASLH